MAVQIVVLVTAQAVVGVAHLLLGKLPAISINLAVRVAQAPRLLFRGLQLLTLVAVAAGQTTTAAPLLLLVQAVRAVAVPVVSTPLRLMLPQELLELLIQAAGVVGLQTALPVATAAPAS